MRHFTILLIGSLIVFAPVGLWAGQHNEVQKQELKAHDPLKNPLAYQDKNGFPTGAGCTVPEGFFDRIDKIMKSNPCARGMYNPCNPCSVKGVSQTASKAGDREKIKSK